MEKKNYTKGYELICGIDEAGRGPLAGPVVAGAVILPKDCEIPYLNDSKKLSAAKREALYDEIMEKAIKKMLSYPTDNSTVVPYRLTTLSVCSRLFYDEMTEGRWRNAVKLGMYILIEYCLIYPPYHPMLAQHYLMLAKACWNSIIQSELINDNLRLDRVYERGVQRWIVSAKETVAVAFGKQSQLWRETLELEWIFLREQNLK